MAKNDAVLDTIAGKFFFQLWRPLPRRDCDGMPLWTGSDGVTTRLDQLHLAHLANIAKKIQTYMAEHERSFELEWWDRAIRNEMMRRAFNNE
jgi:hypothetical protein